MHEDRSHSTELQGQPIDDRFNVRPPPPGSLFNKDCICLRYLRKQIGLAAKRKCCGIRHIQH